MTLPKLIGILILFIKLSACAQTENNNTQSTPIDEWEPLTENNYSLNYPKDWELNKSGLMGTSFILFSPLSSEKDQFKENINLLVQDLTGHNLNLEKYAKLSEGQIKTMITDGNILESKTVATDTLSHHQIIYTGRQGVFNLKFEQYYWVIDDTAYVLTLTCEESQFKNYQKIGEEILNSFKLKQ